MRTVRTLKKYALAGEQGRYWYRDALPALVRLADGMNVSVSRVADILALTSPRVHVSRNVAHTVQYLTESRYPATQGFMPGVKAALKHYEATGIIRGPKTSAFARALVGDGDAVVLDVWMARALNVEQRTLRKRRYRVAAAHVRKVARSLGWAPAEVQAAIWTYKVETHRNILGHRQYIKAPSFAEIILGAGV